MSTHCTINVKIDDKICGIYCHFDGYTEHTYVVLKEHYNSKELAEELVSKGDIEFLNEESSMLKHSGRGTPDIFPNLKEINMEEYNYYFNGERWFCLEIEEDARELKLGKKLDKILNECYN